MAPSQVVGPPRPVKASEPALAVTGPAVSAGDDPGSALAAAAGEGEVAEGAAGWPAPEPLEPAPVPEVLAVDPAGVDAAVVAVPTVVGVPVLEEAAVGEVDGQPAGCRSGRRPRRRGRAGCTPCRSR